MSLSSSRSSTSGRVKSKSLSGWVRRLLALFRARPSVAEPVRISGDFRPEAQPGFSYVWVPEYDLREREAEGFTYYLRPADGAKCYRRVQRGKHVSNEFLMAAPKHQLAA